MVEHGIGTKEPIWERFPELTEIPKDKFPKHILIIPDGNGRWAKQVFEALPIVGHKNGYQVLKEVLKDLRPLPISIVTVWGFSADNWTRPKEEIVGLMSLFEKAIKDDLPDLMANNERLVHLGRKDRIPKSLRETLQEAEKVTELNTGKILCLAIDFGGEDQELRAMQALVDNPLPKGTIVTPEIRRSLLDGKGLIPPADLIIRTSGERRASDLGQLAGNAEFYSIEPVLPETKTSDFVAAIVDFSKRERRFGGRPSQTQKQS